MSYLFVIGCTMTVQRKGLLERAKGQLYEAKGQLYTP